MQEQKFKVNLEIWCKQTLTLILTMNPNLSPLDRIVQEKLL